MKIGLIFLVMAVGTISTSVWADRNIKPEAVRAWVDSGKILSFEEIFQLNKNYLSGKILDLEVEYEDDLIVYEIEQLKESGEVTEVYIDAVTGRFLKEEADD
ncbi:MAG: PepSY domain-containing protein [Pseudomonadales bacterium]